jgi:hypothetical protein
MVNGAPHPPRWRHRRGVVESRLVANRHREAGLAINRKLAGQPGRRNCDIHDAPTQTMQRPRGGAVRLAANTWIPHTVR